MFRPALRPVSAALAAAVCCAPALADHHEGEAHAAVVPDRQILSLLEPMNQAEIEVSRFAAERATLPEVQEFARRMVEEHTRLGQDLTRATRRRAAHGTLTPEQRRRAEQPLRDDGVVTEEEAERVEEKMERRQERREEVRDAREEIAEERAETAEQIREERAEAREEVREERVDSLGDAVDETVRDVREAGDEIEQEVGELGDDARRGARRMRDGVRDGAANLARRADRELNDDDREGMRDRGAMRGHGGPDLHKEIAEKTTASVKEALGRQSGKQFDMGYVNQQMLAHLRMLAAIDVAADHAGPELKTVLQQAHEKTEGHLRTVRELAMKVDKLED